MPRVRPITLLLAAAVLGLVWIGRWSIIEGDLFLQIRAGHEILQDWHVQTQETWSYTAQGAPWFNHEWLATVIDYLASKFSSHYESLAYLRSLLMIGSLTLLVFTVRKCSALVSLVLLPWIFLAIFARFQMRPDLYAMLIFQGLIVLMISEISLKKKKWTGLALLVLWANLHAGTVPFGIFVFGMWLLSLGEIRKNAPWLVAAFASWFATPIGWHIVHVISDLLLQYDRSFTRNADYRGYDLPKLLSEGEWIYLLWPPYVAVALASYFWIDRELPGVYRNRFFVWGVGGVLIALTLLRIRTIHLSTFFLLPIVSVGLERWKKTSVAAVLLALWGFAIPKFILDTKGMHEPRVAEWMFPVHTVEFIRRNHPPGKLLNPSNFGGYLIAELPEYPVAVDGRELPFMDFIRERNRVSRNPAEYGPWLKNLGIGLVLDTYPPPVFDRPHARYTDLDAILYPKQDWALVDFDDASVVIVRRLPENAALIGEHEYKVLRPGLPPNFIVKEPGAAAEVERCLAENPRNRFCLEIKSQL